MDWCISPCTFKAPSPPLTARPSTPQLALTPTAGGLTVQLTVMYPGTREDTLQYSISMSPSSLSRRQTGQPPLPVTNLTTPISGSAKIALGPGTYYVTGTGTNQHGSTMAVPQEVTIPGWRNMVLCVCLSIIFVFCVLCLLKTEFAYNNLLRCISISNSTTTSCHTPDTPGCGVW